MSLTPQQHYHILIVAIDELSRLARKFGLDEGVAKLRTFERSLSHNTNSLAAALSALDSDGKHKNALEQFKVLYKEQQFMLGLLITQIFDVEKETKKWQKGFKKILEAEDKEIKIILKEKNETLLAKLEQHIRGQLKEFIKAQFGVAKEDILAARKIMQSSLATPDAQSKHAMVNSMVQLSLILAANPRPGNYSYHSIAINGLYKMIKIVNGLVDKDLAQEFLPIFSKTDASSKLIIKSFFAAETTKKYCRNPSLLIQILTLLINEDSELISLSAAFVSGMVNPASLQRKNTDLPTLVTELITNLVKSCARFSSLFEIIKQDVADRGTKIAALKAEPEVFIKRAFYFGFISPLLANIELKLASYRSETEIKALRLELSTLFDIVLGFRSAEQLIKIAASGVIAPALLAIATDKQMQQRVTEVITSGVLTATSGKHYDADDEHPQKKHQRRRSQSLTLGAIQSLPAKKQDVSVSNVTGSTSYQPYHKKLSFYCQKSQAPNSSPIGRHKPEAAAAKVSLLKNRALETDSLESFFQDFISTNSQENATSFILSLIRSRDETALSWGLSVLNQAVNKQNKLIADVLLEHLLPEERAMVIQRLFLAEQKETWCRGNKLLPALIQRALLSEAGLAFKEFIWQQASSLLPFIGQIKIAQRKSLPGLVSDFSADEHVISSTQKACSSMLTAILSPTHFPPVMQQIITLAYDDLIRKDGTQDNKETRDRTLMSFILLRFINPVIQEKTQANPSIATEGRILIAAIQSLSSLTIKMAIEEERTIQSVIFDPVTKNQSLRDSLFTAIAQKLDFNSIASVADLSSIDNKALSVTPDIKQAIARLSTLLEHEFPSLNFKGSLVISPRRESRPSISSMFAKPAIEQPQTVNKQQPIAAPSGY